MKSPKRFLNFLIHEPSLQLYSRLSLLIARLTFEGRHSDVYFADIASQTLVGLLEKKGQPASGLHSTPVNIQRQQAEQVVSGTEQAVSGTEQLQGCVSNVDQVREAVHDGNVVEMAQLCREFSVSSHAFPVSVDQSSEVAAFRSKFGQIISQVQQVQVPQLSKEEEARLFKEFQRIHVDSLSRDVTYNKPVIDYSPMSDDLLKHIRFKSNSRAEPGSLCRRVFFPRGLFRYVCFISIEAFQTLSGEFFVPEYKGCGMPKAIYPIMQMQPGKETLECVEGRMCYLFKMLHQLMTGLRSGQIVCSDNDVRAVWKEIRYHLYIMHICVECLRYIIAHSSDQSLSLQAASSEQYLRDTSDTLMDLDLWCNSADLISFLINGHQGASGSGVV